MSTVNIKVDGFEVHVEDGQEAFARNVVEVSVGRRIPEGLLVERVEPVRIGQMGIPDALDPVSTKTIITWENVQRIVRLRDASPSYPPAAEDDTVVVRCRRDQARAIAYGLLAWAGEDPTVPAPSPDIEALQIERVRVDKMLNVLLDLAAPESRQ